MRCCFSQPKRGSAAVLFNSLQFAIFFPLVCITSFLLPAKWRVAFLLIASSFFYCSYIPVYLLILVVVILVDYFAALTIEKADESRKSLYLATSILANVAILGFFKYYNFGLDNIRVVMGWFGAAPTVLPYLEIALPIGLSFHTFQSMSYTIEVRAGRYPAERNFIVYALYVMFFPQLVAGPIERPQGLLAQLVEKRDFDRARAVRGLQLMLWGFIKKVVVADRLAPLVDSVYTDHGMYSGPILMLVTVLFAIQLYCDFSGYSDIAIGAAEVLGYRLMENFRRPLFAPNLMEFWQRWHISLITWFRDYVFYPLFFCTQRLYFATMFVFMLSGFWHGASWNFAIWGVIHGVALSFLFWQRKRFPPPETATKASAVMILVSTLATFAFFSLTLVFFRAPDLTASMNILSRMALTLTSFSSGVALSQDDELWILRSLDDLTWGVVAIAILFIGEYLQDWWSLRQHPERYNRVSRTALYYCALVLLLFLGKYDARPFIYFQF